MSDSRLLVFAACVDVFEVAEGWSSEGAVLTAAVEGDSSRLRFLGRAEDVELGADACAGGCSAAADVVSPRP